MARTHAGLRAFMDRFVGLQFAAATVLFTLTGVLMAAQVLARKGLGLPLVWAEDLTVFMFVWTTFLGAAVLYHRREAMAIDALVSRLSARAQRRVGLGVDLLLLVALVYLCKLSWDFLVIQRGMGHRLGGATGIPSWVLTLSVLVGFVSMTGSTVASLMKQLAPAREAA
jgi:TRAP-type C4-dicarboxylate transport system permease small subunit